MALLLNLLLPGAGLILRRREWVGFLLCLNFGLCGNVALAGLLIAPDSLPLWIVYLAISLATLTWFVSQVLFWRAAAAQRSMMAESH